MSLAWRCVAKVINRKDACQALVRPWERASGRANICDFTEWVMTLIPCFLSLLLLL